MIPQFVRALIDNAYCYDVNYTRDCDALSADIFSKTGKQLSASTLKRVLGFVEDRKQLRKYTLDIIAIYCSYKNWDKLISANTYDKIETNKIEKDKLLFINTEKRNQYLFRFKGDNFLQVIHSNDDIVKMNDLICIHYFQKGISIAFENIIRDGVDIGSYRSPMQDSIFDVLFINYDKKYISKDIIFNDEIILYSVTDDLKITWFNDAFERCLLYPKSEMGKISIVDIVDDHTKKDVKKRDSTLRKVTIPTYTQI